MQEETFLKDGRPGGMKLMNENYKSYRKTKIESGQLYQDFIVDICWQTIGLAIVQYSSREYQINVGESRTGVEIKHDEKYSKTGNLFIEVAEKAEPRDGPYSPSGIFRKDNSWLYIIGDYDMIFIFQKQLLRLLSKRYKIIESLTKTSLGYLLPKADAFNYADPILTPNSSTKISKMEKDLLLIGRELHELVKSNPCQLSLFEFNGKMTNRLDR